MATATATATVATATGPTSTRAKSTRARTTGPSTAADLIATLHDDPQECARIAQLRYVSPDDPGISRRRSGKGFTYRDAEGITVVDVEVRDRIKKIAIPPAWQHVWICNLPDGHILAVGEDEKGRRQYIYHERWRSIRDQLNFYRLIGFAAALPAIRSDVDAQLRRRTLDRERVIAAMLRIIDVAGLRVGNEAYAEENDSYGLTTLRRQHVQVSGSTVSFDFPAKSGKTARTSLRDPGVARVIATLAVKRGRRLFSLDGKPISSDEINHRLADLSGAHLTAKDFRTWNGTVTAFRVLREHLPAGDDADAQVLAAIDAAAEKLNNTRSVCRAHYVHPEVLSAYTSGELDAVVGGTRGRGGATAPDAMWLDTDERLLTRFLSDSLAARAEDLFT